MFVNVKPMEQTRKECNRQHKLRNDLRVGTPYLFHKESRVAKNLWLRKHRERLLRRCHADECDEFGCSTSLKR